MKNKSLFYSSGISFLICLLLSLSFKVFSQESNDITGLKIEVKEVEAAKALVIKTSVPINEIGPKMGEMYGKLFGFLEENNIEPVGPPFAVYYEFNPEGNTTFETGIPVAQTVEGNEVISFKEFPAMKVATTIYTGAYETFIPVYEALSKYLEENKLESDGTTWEIYLTDPNEVEDPNENQTIIYFPIK